MKQDIFVDPDSGVVEEQYAVVYAPRRQLDRFPDSCVELHATAGEALAAADPGKSATRRG